MPSDLSAAKAWFDDLMASTSSIRISPWTLQGCNSQVGSPMQGHKACVRMMGLHAVYTKQFLKNGVAGAGCGLYDRASSKEPTC